MMVTKLSRGFILAAATATTEKSAGGSLQWDVQHLLAGIYI